MSALSVKGAAPGKLAPHGAAPFPPALTGGESRQGAKVDWLTVTWYPDPDEHIPATVHALLSDVVGGVHGDSVAGMFGYEKGVRFYVALNDGARHHVGRLDYGGLHHRGRARLDLSGSACARISAWGAVSAWIERQCEYKLTRVDLAVDCLAGEFSVEDAKAWLLAGEFNAGGRNPRHSTPGDWLTAEPVHGRTLEIGRRENGKMLRAYEKGLQLRPGSGDKWTRFEVELRNIDRDLPLDVLTDCDRYFVGAYRCLQRLLAVAGEKISTHQKEGELSMQALNEHCRTSYGRYVNVLRSVLSAEQVLDALSLPGVPRRLEKASLAGFTSAVEPAAFLKERYCESERDRV